MVPMKFEFHDSTLSEIADEGGEVVFRFRPAYVCVEEDDALFGYEQDVDLRFFEARLLSRPTVIPVWISDGLLRTISGMVFDGLIPIPFSIQEEVSFSGFTAEGESYHVVAASCTVEPIGMRSFVEKIR